MSLTSLSASYTVNTRLIRSSPFSINMFKAAACSGLMALALSEGGREDIGYIDSEKAEREWRVEERIMSR